ncbi:MAG: hypothetical protein ABIC19_03365 [Patescibacteria group bacterium]|nr:hypothetical protein [Patescibacteria group bacterium]
MNLTSRQEKILTCIIKEYTRTAIPVGSLNILKRYLFDISPATMRAEMAFLERHNFLYQPHVSAGRVPTDKGYRYFVNSLMKNHSLTQKEQVLLQQELLKQKIKNQRLARTTAKLLAALSHNLAISGLVEEEEYFQSGIQEFLSQPDFSDIDEICRTVEVLDYLDQSIEKLLKKLEPGKVSTFIGRENPLSKSKDCSVIISRYQLPRGQTGIIAIMGPKRMHYDKNISLIKYVTNLLED